jgi:hypothetical protein
MAVGTTLKSAQITNFDASPIVLNTSGVSGPYTRTWYDSYVTTGSDNDAGTKYVMIRVKSNVKVKKIELESAAQGATFTVNIGLYYADDVRYLAPGNSLLAGTVIDADFFGSAVVLTNAVTPTDVTNEGGFYSLDERELPLWDAAGLTADPGGYFDIVITTTVAGTGGALLGLRAAVSEN